MFNTATATATTAAARLPRKTREIRNNHMDSTIWNRWRFRDDDIVIGTYAKSGTTWTQQIVSQLIFNGRPDEPVAEISPWLDFRFPSAEVKLPPLEAQTHRRFIKTHLPVDALVFSPRAKYLYIGRDGRDVIWSMYNHHASGNAAYYDVINNTPGRVGPPLDPPPADIRQYFRDWLDGDGLPFWSFWENIRTWWDIRDLPNVMLLHFGELKADLPGAIRRIAAFLEIDIDPLRFDTIVKHCTFDWMKKHAKATVPLGGALWDGGASTFIHKGVNGRWRDTLSVADSQRYEQRVLDELGPACAHWLATGDMPAWS